MATMWRRAMHYLGLGPDDEYDDGQGFGYEDPSSMSPSAPVGTPGSQLGQGRPMPPMGVSRVDPGPAPTRQGSEHGVTVRPVGMSPQPLRPAGSVGLGREAVSRTSGSVRQIPAAPQLQLVEPLSFNDAQAVGDHFKAGQPVAMDLAGVDRDLARRLIDFCSGLCFGLGGQMERVASHNYLIVPAGAEVSEEDRRRLEGTGG